MLDVYNLLFVKTYVICLIMYAYVTRYTGFKTCCTNIENFKTNILLASNLQFVKEMRLITHYQLELE